MLNSRTYKLTLVALMTALLSVSAYLRIPTPITPITLQCEVVILGAMLWGRKVTVSATVLYIIMGLAGLPVFSGGGGIHYVITPTFGYLLGFILCALVARNGKGAYLGLALIYATGIGYMYIMGEVILGTPIAMSAIAITSAVTLPIDIILTYFTIKTAKKLRTP